MAHPSPAGAGATEATPSRVAFFVALADLGARLARGASSRVPAALSGLAVASVLAVAPAAVQPVRAQSTPAADSARTLCAACHGPQGLSQIPGTPSLAGQPRTFLETQLVMIREGLREVPAMKGMLDKLTDPDLTALAAWYSAQAQAPASTGAPGADANASIERGGTLARQALCGTCHLPSYHGQQQVPRLAGQREDYLLQTMVLMRDGKAAGRDSIMAATLRGMSDAQLTDLARHFAALR
jgi:cytochrome c553